ncbi:g7791 [Coccomyxa elongata]
MESRQANGAKLLAFYRHILTLFDDGCEPPEPVQGVNTQVEKTMLGFFEDLLAAQFADCPMELQSYGVLDDRDRDAIKAVAKRIDTKVRERIRARDAYSETLGAALTEQDMLKFYHLTVEQTKGYNRANILSLKAIFAHMYLNANRGTREIRLLLRNVVDEELDVSAKSTLRGASTERLLVHGFALQTGGPEGQDKQRGKTARWELDGFMRHADLDLCGASKVAHYMLVRFRDLPLQPALTSAEALLAFLDSVFFLRHYSRKKPPRAYNDKTINCVLRGGREGSNCKGLEHRAGVEHVNGKLMHRIKHGAVRRHIDCLGSHEEARLYAKHGGKVHEASYSNRQWVPKLAMAKVAGHRDGFVQLYRAGIWCSAEEDAGFRALFDRITPISDAQLVAAEALMEGRKEWAGVRATLVALRNYTDVILQDLVEWVDHPVLGPDYRAATDRFPFLAAKDLQYVDWLRFCAASKAKAAALRDADADVAPQTPPMRPPVQELSSEQDWEVLELLEPEEEPPLAAGIDLIVEVPDALTAPSRGWTAAALYARYSEPLKPGLPTLREVMVHQGHLNWTTPGRDRKAALWMNKFWSRICCEVNAGGKELEQALRDAQDEYEKWGTDHRAKRAKLMDGEKSSGRKGFKAWVEDEVLPAVSGWHLL